MRLKSAALALLLAATTALHAQPSTFDLQSAGRSLGKATYSIAKAKQGYKMSSRLSYHINGVESDISNDFTYTDAYAYIQGASYVTSSQLHISFTPNKPRTDLVIGNMQAGVQDSKHLPIKPDFIVMPHYDPGAAQAMLLLATTHPTPQNLYNIVIPGSSVPGGGAPPSDNGEPSGHQTPGNNAYDALWTKAADTTGTLDGKPIPIHSYVLTAGKNTWTFFADSDNNLMQLDNTMVKASYIRAKFKLDPPQ